MQGGKIYVTLRWKFLSDTMKHLHITIRYFLLFWLAAAALSAHGFSYHFGPDNSADMLKCRIFDANADGYTWKFSSRGPELLYEGNNNDADEYIFLPPVQITDTGTYRLSFLSMRDAVPQRLTVGYATRQSVASVVPVRTLTTEMSANDYTPVGADFHFSAPGAYYPVLHLTTPGEGLAVRCRDFRLAKAETGGRSVPLSLTPDVAEASEFDVLDGDADGFSWHYEADSAVFRVEVCHKPKANDWLMLPPVRMAAGNYAFSFDVSPNGGAAEPYEVLLKRAEADSAQWQPLVRHPGLVKQRRETALFTISDSALYCVAVRYTGTGGSGSGLTVRRFSIDRSNDSAITLPGSVKTDTLLTDGKNPWLILPPFRAPRYKAVCVEVRYRGTSPQSPVFEMYSGPVNDTTLFTKLSASYDVVNSELRSKTQQIYYGDDAQMVFALRVRNGSAVIGDINIDTVYNPLPGQGIPYSFGRDTVLEFPALFGPVWVERQNNALQLQIKAKGGYRLFYGKRPSLSAMTELHPLQSADSAEQQFLAAPLGLAMHYLALIPDSVVHLQQIDIRESSYQCNGPGMPRVKAHPIALPGGEVEAEVVLPATNLAGNRLWPDELILLRVTSPCDTVSSSGYSGDTLRLRLRAGEGTVKIKAQLGTWPGWGPEGFCMVRSGNDAPARLTILSAAADADNMGALLTWHADSAGVNGGYVNPDSLRYRIDYRLADGWITADTVSGEKCHIRPALTEQDNTQRIMQWRVTAFNTLGESQPDSIGLLMGKPLPLPVTENYRPGMKRLLPWMLTGKGQSTLLPAGSDPARPFNHPLQVEGEAGSAIMLPAFVPQQDTKLSLRVKSGQTPDLAIIMQQKGVEHTLDTIPLSIMGKGWYEVYLRLPDSLASLPAVRLMLKPLAKTPYTLAVSEYISTTLNGTPALNWVSRPDTLTLGEGNIIKAQFINKTANELRLPAPRLRLLSLHADKTVYASEAPSEVLLKPGQSIALTYRFSMPAEFYGTTVSGTVAVVDTLQKVVAQLTQSFAVEAGEQPVVVDLTAEADVAPSAAVMLRWGEPVWQPLDSRRSGYFDSWFVVYRDSLPVADNISGCQYTDSVPEPGRYVYHVALCKGAMIYPLSNPAYIYMSAEQLAVQGVTTDVARIEPVMQGVRASGLCGSRLSIAAPDGRLVLTRLITADDEVIPLEPGLYIISSDKTSPIKIAVR